MASRDKVADAEECKVKGNEALAAKDFDRAIEWYTQAINLHEGHVYYSNRSAAYLSKGYADSALKDAEKCIELKSDWPKGYARKGAALHKLAKYDEGIAAYEEGLKVDPESAPLKSGLEAIKADQAGPSMGAGGAGGLGALFGPDFMEKVKANPKLEKYTSDPTYMQLLEMIQTNPQMLQVAAQDPRIQETFAEILNIKFQTADGGPPPTQETAEDRENRRKAEKEREERLKREEEEREKARKEEEERVRREQETPEEREKRENKEKAVEIKNQGNEFYKKKEFEEALKLYNQAIELDPETMTYPLNIASVKLEQGDLEGCLEQCKKAIEVGHAAHADFQQIAKAYERMGNAYVKHKMYQESLQWFQKAQLEHSTPVVANKIKKIEVIMKKAEAEAYVDPELALKAKEEGNVKFKAGDFPGAIADYSEAIKRDPKNAVYYGNRSVAYMKMADFGRSMDDCDKALELDPKYAKMYVRKGNIQFFLKEYHKCIKSYTKALELEPDNSEAQQGLAKTKYAVQTGSGSNDKERAARAMEDPEIQGIMADPVMQQILRDMSQDPSSAQKHMSNPEVATKIEMLIAAGVLQMK
mmetsp:Transcript_12576/g.22403  ORF Transcript_12576/g.22403 Transcript_12576/m.22403 type:complete len:587 (+) Transcript_12576:159-1919(+)